MFTWKISREDSKSSELDILLKEYNITQGALAETLDVSPKTLRNYINNPGAMPLSVVDELCRLFNKQFEDLFAYEKYDKKDVPKYEYSNLDAGLELTKARDLYIDGFGFFEDNNSKGFNDFKSFILSKLHKPLLTFIGAADSDLNTFLSILLNDDIPAIQNPIYYLNKKDLPENLQHYENIAIKTIPNEEFNVFLLNDPLYLKKFEYKEYESEKEYQKEYVVIKTSENVLLQKCAILILPNISFVEVYRRNKPQNKTKRLTDYSVYSLIRYVNLSDFILYFENTLNFFTAEKAQIIQYLIDNSCLADTTTRVLFVESKCKDVGMVGNKEKAELNAKYFYDGRRSFKVDSSVEDCIEQLNLDFTNITSLLSRIDKEINNIINNTLENGYFFHEKSDIKQMLLTVIDTDSQDKSDENEKINDVSDSKEQNTLLKGCLKNFENSEVIKNILPKNIKTKDDMICTIQTFSEKILKQYLDKYDVHDGHSLQPVKLIINNILIPYFLLEMTFAIGNEATWANKIKDEIESFKENSKYLQIIEDLIEQRVSYE